ncbi:hypothetical protein AwMethylo_40910 [Methylobacterium sp.]|nr:hypothetical protein AwMethylo_40910 [Methylobacterium sp.]
MALLAQHEAETGARLRKRRETDQRHHLTAVEAVVANLAHAVLMPADSGRLAVFLKHGEKGRTRYDNPAFGKPFSGLLDRMDELGILSIRAPACQWREASSIAPTPAFAAKVRETGITLTDFGRLAGEEPIILRRRAQRPGASASGYSGRLVDYPDTAGTVAMRSTVQGLNAYLGAADVAFRDDGRGLVDHRHRHMSRCFVLHADDEGPRFDRSGRLYGGFWQNLERSRRSRIRVEGEPVEDLDFASMFPRLAYASTGRVPPEGDLYAVDGLGPEHRSALKLAMNTILFDAYRRTSWPVPEKEDDPRLPAEWTVARTKAAILKRHPALKSCFGVGLGFSLMHTESVILVHVLEEMRARGIVGLGLHNGLLLPRSRVEEGRIIMEAVARDVTGQSLPVVLKARASVSS